MTDETSGERASTTKSEYESATADDGWVDLSQPFSDDMPHPPAVPAPAFETVRDVAEDRINVQQYTAATHVGTHVDAPRHFVEGGATIDELPLDRFAGDGVFLDVSTDDAREITVEDVEQADGTVRENDIVLLYTGWQEKYGTPDYVSHPWLSVDLAEWLVERGVKMVATDTLTPDIPPPRRPEGWMAFPVHRRLLTEGVLVAENLTNLDTHVGKRLEVQGFPVKIRDGDGAPVRFVARRR
uniref:cyclase family protein n=1 Tax=Haloprofundus sp. MHR1 TaxID=2572921 RepID=UPI001F1D6F63|nr:cyclase family protein [Haloprofundus sp. MHR1]